MNIELAKVKRIVDDKRMFSGGPEDFETIKITCDYSEFDEAQKILKKFEEN